MNTITLSPMEFRYSMVIAIGPIEEQCSPGVHAAYDKYTFEYQVHLEGSSTPVVRRVTCIGAANRGAYQRAIELDHCEKLAAFRQAIITMPSLGTNV